MFASLVHKQPPGLGLTRTPLLTAVVLLYLSLSYDIFIIKKFARDSTLSSFEGKISAKKINTYILLYIFWMESHMIFSFILNVKCQSFHEGGCFWRNWTIQIPIKVAWTWQWCSRCRKLRRATFHNSYFTNFFYTVFFLKRWEKVVKCTWKIALYFKMDCQP